MATQRDHIENALNQLLAKKHQLESEVREIEEAIHALNKVPALLGDHPTIRKPVESVKVVTSGGHVNRDLAEKVRAYLLTFPYSQKIDVNTMIEELKDKGVQGKKTSLYAYIHSLLKKWVQKKEAGLQYQAGVGYTRERDPIYKAPDAELVHIA